VIPGGDRGAITVKVTPAMASDPETLDMIRQSATAKAAEKGGRLLDEPPVRVVIPAHESEVGPMPEMVRLTFTMVRL
jgi:hypothetical protein